MKRIFLLLLTVSCICRAYSQTTGYIRNDTIKLTNATKTATVFLETASKGHDWYLKDIGNGRLQFVQTTIDDIDHLQDSLAKKANISGGNSFTGNQSITGQLSATSISQNGNQVANDNSVIHNQNSSAESASYWLNGTETFTPTITGSSGTNTPPFIYSPIVNQSGTAQYNLFQISPYIQRIGGTEFGSTILDIGYRSAPYPSGTHISLFSFDRLGDFSSARSVIVGNSAMQTNLISTQFYQTIGGISQQVGGLIGAGGLINLKSATMGTNLYSGTPSITVSDYQAGFIGIPTFEVGNGVTHSIVTITDASTFTIEGTPIPYDSNTILTNRWGLRVKAGNSYFGGKITVAGAPINPNDGVRLSDIDSLSSIHVSTISQLQAYSGTATTIIVQDSLRGGTFNYIGNALNDGGIYFTATGKGSGSWVRSYNGGAVYPEWWGATGNGTSDDQSAMQLAINYSNRVALRHGANYAVTRLELPADYDSFELVGNGARINNSFALTGNSVIVTDTTARLTNYAYTVSANPVAGDSTIVLSSVSGISAGDYIYLRSAESVGPVQTRYKKGELMTVKKVSGTTLTFQQAFNFNMDKSLITVTKVKPLKLAISDLNITSYNTADTVLNLDYLRDVKLDRININPVSTVNVGVNVNECWGGVISQITGKNFISAVVGSGYGVNATGRNLIVQNSIISNCYHCITSAASAYLCNNITFKNNTVTGANSYGLDFHANVIDGTFENNTVQNSIGGMRARNTFGFTANNNKVSDIYTNGLILNPEITDTISRVNITGNYFVRTDLSNATGGAITVPQDNDIVDGNISGNVITTGYRGIYIQSRRGIHRSTITGNKFSGLQSHAIAVKGNDLLIYNNNITSFGLGSSTAFGIYLLDTSNSVRVTHNIIKKTATNDGQGIRVQGLVSNSLFAFNDVRSFTQANGISTSSATGTGNKVVYNSKANGLEADADLTASQLIGTDTNKNLVSVQLVATNATTTSLSSSTLNSTYPSAQTGFQVICASISAGPIIYVKSVSGWLSMPVTVVP